MPGAGAQSPEEVVEIVRRHSAWRLPGGAARGTAGPDRPGVGPVLDAGAGTGVPVRVQGRGDHELRPGDRGCPDAGPAGCIGDRVHTWEDELGLDRWRTGDVFGEAELPVLFAHGQHNRPDSVVLATTEYRRAYAGKLPARPGPADGRAPGVDRVQLRRPADRGDLAGDRRPDGHPGRTRAARRAMSRSWRGIRPPRATTHGILARRAEIAYGAQVVLYPAPGGDHSALGAAAVGADRCPVPAGR